MTAIHIAHLKILSSINCQIIVEICTKAAILKDVSVLKSCLFCDLWNFMKNLAVFFFLFKLLESQIHGLKTEMLIKIYTITFWLQFKTSQILCFRFQNDIFKNRSLWSQPLPALQSTTDDRWVAGRRLSTSLSQQPAASGGSGLNEMNVTKKELCAKLPKTFVQRLSWWPAS